MSQIVYLLRKPAPVVEAARLHGTGGIDLEELRPPSGTWPTNVVVAHADGCSAGSCAAGCPVRALAESLGDNVRSLTAVADPAPEESPW